VTRTTAKAAHGGTRAAVGTILPESEYELPLLRALVEADGSGPAARIIDRVGELLDGRLTELDLQRHRTGEVRWRNRTAFTRYKLVQRGPMDAGSRRGIWAITDAGRAFYEERAVE
jgi:restriction system protein